MRHIGPYTPTPLLDRWERRIGPISSVLASLGVTPHRSSSDSIQGKEEEDYKKHVLPTGTSLFMYRSLTCTLFEVQNSY